MIVMDIMNKCSHVQSDFMFHGAFLVKACDNKLMTWMMLTVRGLMKVSIQFITKVEGTDWRAYDGHCQVYDMKANSDKGGAKKTMLEYLKKVEKDLFKVQEVIFGQPVNSTTAGV